VSKNLEQLAEELSGLTVLDMSKLKEMLEEKWGVKASAAPVAMMAAPAAGAAAPAAASESADYQVILADSPADKKIGVIKVIRELTGLGLKEAKELVEAVPNKEVKASAPKAEAEDMKKKLEAAGAKVTLKGL
jgi:large subunit ribosomal protein L7/L12